jgi:phage tail protein X
MGRYENYTYSVNSKLDVENKRRYYDSILDPVIERSVTYIYVIDSIGERLDLLAWKYYKDATLWWIIAAANPELRKDSLYLEPGIQVRVPKDYQAVIQLYSNQQKAR